MAKCTDCFHYEACSGFKPTDLDEDVWHYCKMGIPEEIPDIEKRCDSFKDRTSWVEVVRCKDCKSWEQYNACDGTKPHRCMNHDAIFYKRTAPDDFCSYGERRTDVQGTD